MTHHHHHHDHDHDHESHDHGHDHEHHHHGHQDTSSPMTDREKLLKLMDHWVAHNNDHAGNYLQWSKKAEELGYDQAARLLKDAADLTHEISEKFVQVKNMVKKA